MIPDEQEIGDMGYSLDRDTGLQLADDQQLKQIMCRKIIAQFTLLGFWRSLSQTGIGISLDSLTFLRVSSKTTENARNIILKLRKRRLKEELKEQKDDQKPLFQAQNKKKQLDDLRIGQKLQKRTFWVRTTTRKSKKVKSFRLKRLRSSQSNNFKKEFAQKSQLQQIERLPTSSTLKIKQTIYQYKLRKQALQATLKYRDKNYIVLLCLIKKLSNILNQQQNNKCNMLNLSDTIMYHINSETGQFPKQFPSSKLDHDEVNNEMFSNPIIKFVCLTQIPASCFQLSYLKPQISLLSGQVSRYLSQYIINQISISSQLLFIIFMKIIFHHQMVSQDSMLRTVPKLQQWNQTQRLQLAPPSSIRKWSSS